jgi:hypothetical protein
MALGLSACGERVEQTTTGQAESATVVLAGKASPAEVCLYQARQTGAFAAAGLNVSLVVPSNPAAPLEMLGNKTADLAEAEPQKLLTDRAGGAPFLSVALLTTTPISHLPEPTAKPVKRARGKKASVPLQVSPMILAATRETIGTKGSVLRRILQAAGRACAGGASTLKPGLTAAAASHPASAGAARNPRPGPPLTTPRGSHPWGWQPPTEWKSLEAQLRSTGKLTGPVSANTAFTNEFLAGQGA